MGQERTNHPARTTFASALIKAPFYEFTA